MQLNYFELFLSNTDFLSCCVSSSLSALLADDVTVKRQYFKLFYYSVISIRLSSNATMPPS